VRKSHGSSSRSVALRKILGTHSLSFRELATVLTDIEFAVNRRPISYVNNNPHEITALTPGDLLYGIKQKKRFPDHLSAKTCPEQV
jgi:hypothetical protein